MFPAATGPALAHPLVACQHCGLVFQRDLPHLAALDAAQENAYAAPGRRFGGLIEAGVRLFRGSRVRLAERLMPPHARVLDVGCGRGLFLALLRERGHEVRGTELSAATARNALPGVPVDTGELRADQYPPESFDLVSIWHVLEHLRAPDVAVALAARSLRSGGALLIAVPNLDSLQARLGGERWFHLDLPRHLFHFTPETLRRLLETRGFRIESLRTGQWEMDPFGLLQTALNRLGLRHNALYDALRANPTVRVDLALPYRLAMWALFVPGMALAIPFSLAFRALGRGGTIVVVARKP